MQRASFWKLIGLNFCWLGLSFMWNSLHVILLPAALLAYVQPGLKNTILGLLTGSGLVIAMVVQPLAGAVSDRWPSRWGRRRPLILFGTLADLLFLAVLGAAGGLPALAIGYIGLQFSSNFAHSAMQGLMPDVLSPEQLGRGSAFKTVLDMIGLVVASLFIGRMLPPDSEVITGPVALVIAVLVLSTAVTLLTTREQGRQPGEGSRTDAKPIRETFRVDFHKHTAFAWLIVSRLAFLLGVYGIQSFAQYFVRDTLPDANPVQLTGDLMALIVLGLVFCSIIAGILCDRFGTRPIHAAAAFLVSTGSLAMLLAHTPGAVLGCGLVIGSGIGLFLTANWALCNQLAPAAEAGKFLGLTNLATAGAGALSRLFGPVIDLVNFSSPARYLGYSVLFIASAVFAVAGFLLMSKVYRSREPQQALGTV